MKIGVVGNARYAGLQAIFYRVHALATSLGVELACEADIQHLWPAPLQLLPPHAEGCEALLTFGGDGTLLRAARLLGGAPIPILGINLGRVGFLTTAGAHDFEAAITTLVRGGCIIESRQVLTSTLRESDEDRNVPVPEQVLPPALNDLVVHKSGVARLIRLSVEIDGDPMATYSADGLIVATPTGSTAYSLSAGGPIIVPGVQALVVTPVCAHTLAVRPVVIASGATVTIRPIGEAAVNVLISIDGQKATGLLPGQRLEIKSGERPVLLARLTRGDYFQRMRATLHWGDLSDREEPQ